MPNICGFWLRYALVCCTQNWTLSAPFPPAHRSFAAPLLNSTMYIEKIREKFQFLPRKSTFGAP
jgi:hypothetical protein